MDDRLDKNGQNRSWLEPVLARELGPVEAPGELWERIQNPRPARVDVRRPLAWSVALCVGTLCVAALTLGLRARESHAAAPAELQSSDPAQIREWARRGAGIDLALPDKVAPSVQLLNARLVNSAAPAVEVSYRVWDRTATLLVARAPESAGMRHADLRTVSAEGKISWVMRGQMYTISCIDAEDARTACLLCHMS